MELIKLYSGEINKPYEHQAKIAGILEEMNSKGNGNFSTIVSVPTGGGKTRIATDFCLRALSGKGNKVLWLSDTVDLLGQAIGSFAVNNKLRDLNYQLVCGTAVSKDEAGVISRTGKNAINISASDISIDADIVFASVETIVQEKSYQAVSDWLVEVQKHGKIYCIYDEVHHIGAEKTEKLLSKLFGVSDGHAIFTRFAFVGLTATVYRYDSPVKSFNRWFKNGYYNGEICEDDSIYGVGVDTYINNRIEVTSIRELTDAKLLMKPEIIRVDDFKAGIPESSEAAMSYLAEKIIRNYKEKSWNKTIVFVDGINNAKLLNAKLGDKVPSFVYTSETLSGIDNDLSDFQKTDGTKAKLMIAVNMVSEGFDVKNIETIYLYSKVSSQILIRQRVGRVLRIAEGKKKATVYWQNYYDYDKPELVSEYSGTWGDDVVEDEADIQRDIGRWKKGYQLPAGLYLEELPKDIEAEKVIYKRYEYLCALDLFGVDAVIAGVKFFEVNEHKIYVGKKEYKGYEQFYRVIVSDYYSLLILQDKYVTFRDYAKALGVSEQELLEDIKLTCFYMSNSSEKDTKGNISKIEFYVSNEDLKCFYEWVISNDLKMPNSIDLSNESVSFDLNNDDNLIEDTTNNDDMDTNEDVSVKDDICELESFKKYINANEIDSADNLLDGIKIYQSYIAHIESVRAKYQRQYPDILTYGKNKNVLYYEMKSASAIMSVGAIAGKREQGTLKNIKGSLALISKNEDGSYEELRVLARATKDLDDDSLLLAQALVTVPNHISVNAKDVKSYQDAIEDVLESNGNEGIDISKASQEFLMALGYSKNDGIIRMQVELLGNTLPRVLQYVIYCKAYEQLADIVEYYDSDTPLPKVKNITEMKSVYKEILRSYGVKQLDEDLQPVEDVLADFRPYIKAVRYYQGIKPEFLCRMLNEMLRLGHKEGFVFTDGFGGSGTVSLNVDANLNMKQEYNDLGILNEALFKALQSNKGQALKDKVESFIDLILNHTGDELEARKFLSSYTDVIATMKNKKYNFAMESLASIEAKYQKQFEVAVEKHNSGNDLKWLSLDERLTQKEKKYISILEISYKVMDIKEMRAIEEYLHAIMLIIDGLYLEIKDKDSKDVNLSETDLAFIFFMYYFMSSRHFYNDTTIDKFAGFVGMYEQYIDNAASVVADVKIHRSDAIVLANKFKDDDSRVYYYDIPYSETDATNYSSDWFDEVNFVNALSSSKGDYIIASRYNICDGRKGGLDSINFSENGTKLSNKQKNIIKFFMRFLSKEFALRYVDEVKRISTEEENEKAGYEGKDTNPWSFISGDRAAKYIVFAFTNTEQTTSEMGKIGYAKNHYTVTKDSVRRMLKYTQISNVEVEIMLTNSDLDMSRMPACQIKGEDGMWYVPSFKTQSSYKIEPVTIIMEYDKFVEEMVIFSISENLYKNSNAKNTAAYFRDKYKK